MTLFPGSNNWRSAMQDVSAAIDETMGELVTVTPVRHDTRPNYPSVPEPSKAVTVTAVFTNKAKSVILGDSGRISSGHSLSPIVSTSEPIFSFAYGALPFPVRQGYRITRLCSGAVYEATDVKADGVARIVVPVKYLGVPEQEF